LGNGERALEGELVCLLWCLYNSEMLRILSRSGIVLWLVCVLSFAQAIGGGTPVLPLPVMPESEALGYRIHYVAPAYPAEARKACLHGKVVLELKVDESGAVAHSSLISGETVLADAAKAAVKLWMYQPYIQNGRPVKFITRATVSFPRPNGCSSPSGSTEVHLE
jgi:TonB family protein